MIAVKNLTIKFGSRILFEDVNMKFTPGNCYGIIGANGAGKSTFVKTLSGDFHDHTGELIIPRNLRMAVLKQDHFAYNEYPVLQTVFMGHENLYRIMLEKDGIYDKPDFSEKD